MSVLRYLSPAPRSQATHAPRGPSNPIVQSSLAAASSSKPSSSKGKGVQHHSDSPTLMIHTPNFGILYLPPPDDQDVEPGQTPQNGAAARTSRDEPRDDVMLHGELEIINRNGPRRCKAIRVGLRTVLKLDLGPGRKCEEDVLFERRVEMIGSTADGIWLAQGSQRFDFTLIVPANLAPHDWHPNGTIMQDLYAEVEGMPEPAEWNLKTVSSSSSLFGFRTGKRSPSAAASRAGSRAGSRATSPVRNNRSKSAIPGVQSGRSTPVGHGSGPATPAALAGALANLALNGSHSGPASAGPMTPADSRRGSGGGSGSGGNSGAGGHGGNTLSVPSGGAPGYTISRQEAPVLPRTPSYDDARLARDPQGPVAEWLYGTFRYKRNIMIVYNPDPGLGSSELNDTASGYVAGLGVWNLSMVSDVWTICALLNVKIHIKSLPPTTTLFAIRLVLAQTHSILSPRDEDNPANKKSSTRYFVLVEEGKRPPQGHNYPDKHYSAIWRGTAAGGKHQSVPDADGGEIKIDTRARLPNDDVSRPSTLPGVVTPITVSHALVLEAFFSVFGEDDRGNKMKVPGPGGLRMLRVSRPVILPSCCLLPKTTQLPTYEEHHNDQLAPEVETSDQGFPDWSTCACGMKLEELEKRMRAATIAESGGQSLAGIAAAAAAEEKQSAERGRRGRPEFHRGRSGLGSPSTQSAGPSRTQSPHPVAGASSTGANTPAPSGLSSPAEAADGTRSV